MSESLNLMSLVKDPEMVAKVFKRVKYLQRKYAEEGIFIRLTVQGWGKNVSSPDAGACSCWLK